MRSSWLLTVICVGLISRPALGQGVGDSSESSLRAVPRRATAPIADVIAGTGTLPDEQGQTWREYDIRPFTARVTSSAKPERLIVDWILRETGYETWHSDIPALLSADHDRLRAYHTPETQRIVQSVVDRFVNLDTSNLAVGVRVVTVGHPNWRAKAQPALRPLAIESKGMQAWVLAREDAALILTELQRRIDYREHSAPNTMARNGESVVVAASRNRPYIKDVASVPGALPRTEPGQFTEGFSVEVGTLFSVEGTEVEAILKCQVDQLEKTLPVSLNIADATGTARRSRVEVPQIAGYQAHERFRWPSDSVLLISLGVIPAPVSGDAVNLLGINLPQGTPRADFLIILETKGRIDTSPGASAMVRRARDIQYR